MKTIQLTNYTFNKVTQTITLSDLTTIDLSKILNIIDVTNGQTIFCYRLPGFVGSASSNVLTLQFNTNTNQFNNSDKLYIEYAADNLTNVIIPSTTITGNYSSNEFTNQGFKGAMFIINNTSFSGTTPSYNLRVQAKDPVSGVWSNITDAVSADMTASGNTLLLVYPGLTPVANNKVDYILPRTYRLFATVTGTTPSITFSVSVNYIN